MVHPFGISSIQINVKKKRKNSLAPFYEMNIRTVIVIVYAGNLTNP